MRPTMLLFVQAAPAMSHGGRILTFVYMLFFLALAAAILVAASRSTRRLR